MRSEGRRDGQGDDLRAGPARFDLVERGLDAAKAFGDASVKDLPVLGERDAAWAALEQLDAQVLLHPHQHAAHGRLRDIQLERRLREIAATASRLEREQGVRTGQLPAQALHDLMLYRTQQFWNCSPSSALLHCPCDQRIGCEAM
jgi:hypothetical protein